MDLGAIHPAESAWLDLRGPSGEDLGGAVRIHLAGQDSAKWREAARKQANRLAGKGRRGTASPEDREETALAFLADLTLDWEGVEDSELWPAKGPVPFSAKAAAELYAARPWVRSQVDGFVMDRAAFSKS